MSSLEKLAGTYDGNELKILLINLREDLSKVRTFISAKGYANTVLLDTEGKAAEAYRAIGIPIAYLVDKHGRIADRFIGYVDWNSSRIKSVLDGLIAEP